MVIEYSKLKNAAYSRRGAADIDLPQLFVTSLTQQNAFNFVGNLVSGIGGAKFDPVGLNLRLGP